ncbi:MAG TPA: hypothetical protein PLL54_09765, partial [Dermatophilaceae bacterium]|nr:hypothetical protein [Dermatophilaceae bacterium]
MTHVVINAKRIGSPAGQHHRLPGAVHHWVDRYHLRNIGSTALHMAYVATGGFDAVLVTDLAGAMRHCNRA